MKKCTAEELVKLGAHLGHKKHKVHPKFKPYIYKIESGVSIIDLYISAGLLNKACDYLKEIGSKNKSILVVCTKKNARPIVTKLAQENKIPFLTNKWVGGFLTNFDAIQNNVKRLDEMRESKKSGEWSKFVKHEQVLLEKKLNRIAVIYDGVGTLKHAPEAIIVFDIKKEQNAIKESRMTGVTSIAVTDTNGDPSLIDFPIPANDDSVHTIEYIAKALISSYTEGLSRYKPEKKEVTAKKTL